LRGPSLSPRNLTRPEILLPHSERRFIPGAFGLDNRHGGAFLPAARISSAIALFLFSFDGVAEIGGVKSGVSGTIDRETGTTHTMEPSRPSGGRPGWSDVCFCV
jgi:hypothetical protein